MKHPASRELYAYWDERRAGRPAPERGEIEPGMIRQSLSDTFIVALDAAGRFPFRLAGTRVCALFGRELKDEGFLGLWQEPSRVSIKDLLSLLTEEWVGTVAAVTAQSEAGDSLPLELLLLPLSATRPGLGRAIGVLGPLETPPWLGASPLGRLTLGGRRHVGNLGSHGRASALPRFMRPMTRRSLTVYEGGRS